MKVMKETLIEMVKTTDDPEECQMIAEVIGGGTTNLTMKGSTGSIQLKGYPRQSLLGVTDGRDFG